MTNRDRTRRAVVLALLAAAAASACADSLARHESYIRRGILIRGLHREAFLEEWGPPTRTSVMTVEEETEGDGPPMAGARPERRRAYDVWEYSDPAVTLIFSGTRLSSWKTDLTVQELQKDRR